MVTLQKMMAITGDALLENATTKPYLKSMPHVANEALQLLATAGKYLQRNYVITQTVAGTGENKYNLDTLATNFYGFIPGEVYFLEGGISRKTFDYRIEGENTIVIPADQIGSWVVWYNAFQKPLNKDTGVDVELALDPMLAMLLPLYMASQLYKDDDPGIATQWRNEFEIARGELMPAATVVSRFGW